MAKEQVFQKVCTNSNDAGAYFKKKRINIIIISLSASLLVFLFFLPSLKNDFVNWDDNDFVYNNKHIQALDLSFWIWIFKYHYGNWCPLTWLSHALDYALWGMAPLGHHLTSVVLHSLNTFLFIILVVEFLKTRETSNFIKPSRGHKQFLVITMITAIMAGLFFGLSPLRVESVVWISERRDVLFLFFGLLSILFYLKYYERIAKGQIKRRKGSVVFYLLSFFCFTAGLMCKSMIISLPVVLLLIDLYPLERFSGTKKVKEWGYILLEKLPFLAQCVVFATITYAAQNSAGAVDKFVNVSVTSRVVNSFYSYIFYIAKSILPRDLAPLYLHKEVHLNVLSYQYLTPIILFIIISTFCVLIIRRTRLFIVIWSFYLLSLLPVIGFVQVGNQFAADRYTYFPGLGLALLFGLGVGAAYNKTMSLDKIKNSMSVFLLVLVLCFFGMKIYFLQKQILVWKDSISLWNHEIKLYPGIIAIPYKNRGVAFYEAGLFKEAIRDFTTAIKLRPKDGTIYVNRAASLYKIGDPQKCIKDLITAARLGDISAQENLTANGIKW